MKNISKAFFSLPYFILLALLLLSCRSGQSEMIEETPEPTPTIEIQAPTPIPTEAGSYPIPEEPTAYPAPISQPPPSPVPVDPAYPAPAAPPTVAPAYPGPEMPPTRPAGDSAYPGPVDPEGRTPAPSGDTPQVTPSPLPETSGEPTPEPFERPPGTPMPLPGGTAATITIWHSWSPTEVQVLDSALSAFRSAYPDVYFDVMYFPREDLRRRYEAAAYIGGGPDLLFGPSDWGVPFFEQGLIVDIAELATDDFLSRINPAAVEQGRLGDALVSLPYTIRQGVVMYRNKEIIAAAPATFDELVQVAQAATRGGVVGAYLERSYFYSTAHLYGLGGSLMDESGSPAFNTPQGIEWLRLLQSFAQAGPFEFNGSRDLDAFKTGKAGIIIDGSWNRAALADAIGAHNLAVDPWPAHQNGHLSGFIRTDNVYLNANLNDQDRYQPLLFMAFMLTPEVQSLLTQVGFIPVVIDANIEDQIIQQMVTAFEGAASYPILRQASAYWDPLEAAMQKVFSGSATPAQALSSAESEVRNALKNLDP